MLYSTAKSNKKSPVLNLLEFKNMISSDRTEFHLHFGELSETCANRLIRQQLKIVHKESGIQCYLLFDSFPINQSSVIIQQVMTNSEICEFVWRSIVNCVSSELI